VQILRVDWPVYPRRAEHNTVAEDVPFAVRPPEAGAGAWQTTPSAGLARAHGAGVRRGETAMRDCTYAINGSY
jgi:hypothetical protein